MMMIKVDPAAFAGGPPPPALEAAMGRHIEEMTKAGVLVTTAGLAPPSDGTAIRLGGGRMVVTDGPFTEAKEVVGGFAILEVRSREHAIELGKAFLQLHADTLGPSFTCELDMRQMFGPGAE